MRARTLTTTIVCALALLLCAVPAVASTGSTGGASATTSSTRQADPTATAPADAADPSTGTAAGGASYGVDPTDTPVVPTAKVVDGLAYPPADAPPEVQQAIWAANQIVGKPYVYGGGHRHFKDRGYDCSGTVSYALNGGGLLDAPLDSSSFMHWGEAGHGDWITVYTNPEHAFVVIAGLRLDTSAEGDPGGASGPQWRPVLRSTKGFHARHPVGF